MAHSTSTDIQFETASARSEPRAGRAGAIAAIVMLIAQLAWRLGWSEPGVPSFPEIIVIAVARLTPLDVFGTVTESVGSLAKNSLFVAVLIGTVGIGSSAGVLAGRIARGRRSLGTSLGIALGISAALWLLVAVLLFPIANLGVLASESRDTGAILTQTLATFALYGIALGTLLARSPREATSASAPTVSRRAALSEGAWGVAMLAGVVGLGRLAWELLRPATVSTADLGPSTEELIARQRRLNAGTASPDAAVALSDDEGSGATAQDAVEVDFDALQRQDRLTPALTTVPAFYKVSKNIADPRVPEERWQLTVGGLVARELTLTYDQVRERATTRKITTLCCISNQLNGDLISTGEWTGFPLRELLDEAGVDPVRTVDIRLLCADDYEESFPLAVALDPDTLVVTGLNGQPLDADHGLPCRLIVPNIYGMKNVKWLERIEAVDQDTQGFWQTRGWSDEAVCHIWGRIDYPSDGAEVPAGPTIAAGVAAAGDRGIYRVEISLDEGATWSDARLEPALNEPFTWVRWAFPFRAQSGEQTMTLRAIDGEGTVMDETRRPPLPDGATGWPRRTFTVS